MLINNLMYGYVYKTSNLITGKSYIGKKHSNKFDSTYFGSGIILRKAIAKYGLNCFSVEVLAWAASLSELNTLEKKFITEQNPEYNLAPGGDGGDIISSLPNAKQIREKQRLGIKSWHSRMSAEEKIAWIEKIKAKRKGNFRDGCIPTIEHRKKSSEANVRAWKLDDGSRREIHAKAMEKRRGQQTHNSQKIIINGVNYESLTKAAAALCIARQTLKTRIRKGQIKCSLIEKQ